MFEKDDLRRFIEPQLRDYETAKKELLNGKKESHWIWYIFPQLRGLGLSFNSDYYGIKDIEEAKAYMNAEFHFMGGENIHLGNNLREVTKILLTYETNDLSKVMGYIDSMKVQSCMTLFYMATKEQLFADVVNKFFGTLLDSKTIEMLKA